MGVMLKILAVGTAAILGAENAQAALSLVSQIGGFNNAGFSGADLGYSFGTATGSNRPDGGMFGAEFLNESVVDSVTLTLEGDGADRRRPRNVDVYSDYGRYLTSIEFVDFGANISSPTTPQTVSLGGVRVPSHIILLVTSQYGSGDPNYGVESFSFNGTDLGIPNEINVNALPSTTLVNTGSLGGYDTPGVTKDGNILSNSTNQATFYVRDASNPDTLTANYADEQHIVGIGIGFAGDSGRDVPRTVTVSDSNGNFEVINIDDRFLQYGRYKLTTPFDTTFLRLTFPDGSNAANFFISGDSNYGVTEFQAFIPEPASAGLLVLGGLIMKRRRS